MTTYTQKEEEQNKEEEEEENNDWINVDTRTIHKIRTKTFKLKCKRMMEIFLSGKNPKLH